MLCHLFALAVFLLLTIGYQTRIVSVLACLLTLAYCHRMAGALYGLDQVNAMLSMYLMLAPCGAVYSVDRFLQTRALKPGQSLAVTSAISTTVATRLIQLHMCVI